jgi:hypothetical protein
MRKHALTIVLFVAAAALGAWLWLTRDSVSQDEKTRRSNDVFAAWRREELSRVEIAHEGETIVLERDAKKDAPWRMTSPLADRSDQAAVERLLTTLEFATVKRRANEEGALGLDAPRASGSVTMGGLVVRFALGGPSPRPEGSAYFRVEGEPAIVVAKELADALLQPSDALRDRAVVPYLSIELARFEVKRPGGGFALDRMNEHDFRVAEGGILASREALDKVWGALAEMRAEVFPKDADADRLTASPALTIVMTPKEGGKLPAELVVGDACPGHPDDVVVLRKAPSRVAACAPRAILDALRASPSDLAERHPFAARADEIEELRVEWLVMDEAGARGLGASASAPRAIEIARKGVGFHAREPFDRDLAPAEADAASELVARIATSTAETAVRGGETFTPVARARIHARERDQTIEIGALGGEGRVVLRRELDGARLEVTAAVARRLVPRATSLEPRVLVPGDAPARRANRVILRCGVAQELADDGAGFRYVSPPDVPADGSIVQLVDAITRGKIDLWVADVVAETGSFGLGPDACRVVLGFEGGNDPLTVHLGADGEGGVYGSVDGRPGVFVAPRSLRALASTIFASRAALRVAPDEIRTVRLTKNKKTITAADPAALHDALGALYADRAVELGKPAPIAEDVAIEIASSADGGSSAKRIACGAPLASGARICAASTLPQATFEVAASKLAPFFGGSERSERGMGGMGGAKDAGTVAPDAGSR